ncbi:MAG: SMP-30/gluconolactonase/LRE family protein [Rhodothermales bacterium]
MLDAELIHDTRATLGEGPFWHTDEQCVYWVDIEGQALHRLHPETGAHASFAMPAMLGAAVPMVGGGLLLALADGLAEFDPITEALTYRHRLLADTPKLRANDGKCDAAGRFWIGSMHLDLEPRTGTLYRVTGDYTVTPYLHDLTISNGLAWTADARTLYFIDTPTHAVKAYPFDLDAGTLGEGETVITVPEDAGGPDGMCIDDKGMLWVAHWGGSCVRRWNPHTSEHLATINVPAPHVTSCTFGGPKRDTLYITTARSGLSPEQVAAHPLSGGLFACRPGVTGPSTEAFHRTAS